LVCRHGSVLWHCDFLVAEEIYGNSFKIAGGEGGMKVCWQVTGTRKDPWAAANPFEVEQEKSHEERGRYLQPDLYDASEEQGASRRSASRRSASRSAAASATTTNSTADGLWTFASAGRAPGRGDVLQALLWAAGCWSNLPAGARPGGTSGEFAEDAAGSGYDDQFSWHGAERALDHGDRVEGS
jgi:hypothetical protein